MEEENENSKNSSRRRTDLPQPGAPKRRVRRRRRKNQSAINFLRNFTIAVVLIDLSFAICESNLISTFFLFLTLSSTFEVKPENVIESYCYFQPSGNRMCEDYMQRSMSSPNIPNPATGHPNPGNIGGGGGNGNGGSANTPTGTNHFPTVPSKPPLTDEESYRLFLAYNQSLYETPARFKVVQNLGDSGVFAKVLTKVAQQIFENQTGTQIPQRSVDAVTHQMSILFGMAPPAKQLTAPAAPTFRREIPQVIEAIGKGLVKMKGQMGYQEGVEYIAFREKLRHSVELSQSPIIVNEKFKNLIQIKDFIRHRWKRSALAGLPTSTATETSLTEPHTSGTTPLEEKQPGGMLGSMSSNKSGDDVDGKNPLSNASSGGNAGGRKNTKIDEQTKAVNAAGIGISEYLLNKVGRQREHGHGEGKALESSKDAPPRPEKTSRKPNSIESIRTSISLKSFMKVHSLLERGPRSILGLMESALYNNWKCFLDSAKSYVAPTMQKARQGDAKMSCEVQLGHDLEKAFILSSTRNTTIPVLGLDMNIFSPETYTKAEKRKQAMAQIYHDYGSSVMGQLSSFTEMPVSRSLTVMHWTVKIYSLVWHVVICSILFYGSIYEDKTALNIWGMLNILTSLSHFMIEDWINSTFHPEKSAVAIWFFVVYGLYKPISILLVGTLASEILKTADGSSRRTPGMLCRFRDWLFVTQDAEVDPYCGRHTWRKGGPITGHFFVISKPSSSCGKEAEKAGINGIKKQSLPKSKFRSSAELATVDSEGNLEMYVDKLFWGEESGLCIFCGARSKHNNKDMKMKEAEAGGKDAEKLDIPRSFHYKCSPAAVVSPLCQSKLFTLSDEEEEDDDEDEVEIVAEDDESSDSGDDDNQDDDNDDDDDVEDYGRGRDQGRPPPPTCDNQNHHKHNHTMSMPAQQPELPQRADQGPRTIENCQGSELPNASPPPATLDPIQVQLRNQIIIERSKRSVIDGLIIKPVPDRVDGLLDAPVLDGENPHM